MRLVDLPPLPEAPGVYLFKRGGEVRYVGKAKNLKARVTSYFHAFGKPAEIAAEADELEFIVTRDEVEALLLEANLIKAHRPFHNILLKDDKHYPFLKLTNEPFPILQIVRRVKEDGAKYWGPFPNAGAVRRIKAFIDRTFPLRKNSGSPMRRRKTPCLNHAMGRCLAPCAGLADPAEYAKVVAQVEKVLSGEVDALIEELKVEMAKAAEELNFERAAEIRDTIRALEAFFATRQQAVLGTKETLDFAGLARAGGYVAVQLFQLRSGRILGRVARFMEGAEEQEDAEILAAFLRDYYLEASPLPPLIAAPIVTPAAALTAGLAASLAVRLTAGRLDPDRSVVPLATALADLLGAILIVAAAAWLS